MLVIAPMRAWIGGEIGAPDGISQTWRMQILNMPRKHFYQLQSKSPFDVAVKNAKMSTRSNGSTRSIEGARPYCGEVKSNVAGKPGS